MNKFKRFYKENEDRFNFIYFLINVFLASAILITWSSCNRIIKYEWLRSIFYDLGIGLLGTIVTIIFIDRIIKKMERKNEIEDRLIEEKKMIEQKRREEYNEWNHNLKQDIQATSKHLCDILEMIDIILEIDEKDKKDDIFIDTRNINLVEDMLFVKIRVLAKNLPTRHSFTKHKCLDVNKTLYESINYRELGTHSELTPKKITGNLREKLNNLSGNLNVYKHNKHELKKIKGDISKARMDFLKLRAKTFEEIHREDLLM